MIRRLLARRRLARMVEARRNDPKTLEFIRRRKAALRHEPKVWLNRETRTQWL